MTVTPVPFEPTFGAFVIETLTLGMYGESRNAIREYVQNSFDSLRLAVGEGLIPAALARIDVEMNAARTELKIRDNGLGLRTESAVKVLASVGASNKNYRENAGFRGIGRLAGIVFCDRLVFRTKAKGQNKLTQVVFKAAELRQKLAPESSYDKSAAETLAECVDATVHDVADLDEHFFEVSLQGFFNPPDECLDPEKMRKFLSQVAPIPYADDFPFGQDIVEKARHAGFEVDSVHLYLKVGDGEAKELRKLYGADFGVKSQRAQLSNVTFATSPTGKWFGWIGRKRISGSIKDDSKGIRVRVRNIQIDDTSIMREIFTVSRLKPDKPRTSYARFADWYVGEIFVDPKAAIPNARRDGFEETKGWHEMRDELDVEIATPFGKQAYRTSQAEKLSVENLRTALDRIVDALEALEATGAPRRAEVEALFYEASDLRNRIISGIRVAEPEDVENLQLLAKELSEVQDRLEGLIAAVPAHGGCEEEIGEALREMSDRLLKAFRERLGPQEWRQVRVIVNEVMGLEVD